MPRSARLLRPIATPSTTAISITIAVAITVMDRVTIESFHSPRNRTKRNLRLRVRRVLRTSISDLPEYGT